MRLTGSSSNPTLVGKTGLFLLMISVIVLFGTLSLAFIITPERIDQPFYIPPVFFLNTFLLIASSVLLHLGWSRRNQQDVRNLIRFSLIAGALCLAGQGYGWYLLFNEGITLSVKNPKMHYLYVLSGVHALHLLGGLLFLLDVLRGYRDNARKYFEMAVYFWHFLGVLWVYLLAVLLVNA